MTYDIKQTIAPKGYLRVGINMSNFLLVVGKNEDGDPIGISPDIAKLIAKKIDVKCKFILFERPGQLADVVNDDVWDIGNIAFEPERGNTIDFCNPYILIDANFPKLRFRNIPIDKIKCWIKKLAYTSAETKFK